MSETYLAAKIAVHITGSVSHEVVCETDSGNLVTACELMFIAERAKVRENDLVSCPRCKATHEPTPLPQPETPRAPVRRNHKRPLSGRPQWRPSKSKRQNTSENLKYALTAMIASVEWHNRGSDNQFRENMLDQAALAYRFLGEVLTANGRDTTPIDLEEEDG